MVAGGGAAAGRLYGYGSGMRTGIEVAVVTATHRPALTVLTRVVQACARRPRRVVACSLLVTAVLVVIGLLLKGLVFEDLSVYRVGVNAWRHGGDMYGMLPPTRNGMRLPFIYPPFAAVALSPLAVLPWTASWITMGLLSMGCLAGTLYLTVRRVVPTAGRRGAGVLTTVAVPVSLLLDPVAQTFWFGQVNLLLMGLIALDCLPARTRWPRGVFVGIAAAIKLTPAAFILFFLVRKDYRSAGTAVLTFALAGAVGFLAAPESSWKYWSGSAPGIDGMAGSPYASNQAIRGAIARFGQLSPDAQTVLWLLLCAVALALAGLVMRRAFRDGKPALALVANGGLALLASPISWGHHWVYVAPAVVVLLGAWHRSGRRKAALLTTAVFVLHPYQFLPQNDNRELGWSWWQHLVGNAYGLLSFALLGLAAWPELRRLHTEHSRAREVTAEASPDSSADPVHT